MKFSPTFIVKSVRGEQYLGNDSHAVTYMQCAIILNIEEFSYKRLKLNERKPFALKNLLLNDANNFQQLNKKEKKKLPVSPPESQLCIPLVFLYTF